MDWHKTTNARQEQLGLRLSTYLSGTYASVPSISELARAGANDKTDVERQLVWPHTDRVNSAFTQIELHDSRELVEAVRDFDSALVELVRQARTRQYERLEWRPIRKSVLGASLEVVKQAGRREIRGSGL
jgi:hypothetical protein